MKSFPLFVSCFLLTEWIWGLFLVPNAICLPSCYMSKYENDFKMLEIMKLNLVFRRIQLTFYPREPFCHHALSDCTWKLCVTSASLWSCQELFGNPRHSPTQFPKMTQSKTSAESFHTLICNNAAVPDQNESYPGERKHLIGYVCRFLFHELIPRSETGISNVSSCSTTKGPRIQKRKCDIRNILKNVVIGR